MKSYAFFDSLSIAQHLEPALGSAARGELHLFSYLACILFLIDENPVSDWEYAFAATGSGTPFSWELNEAIDQSQRAGLLELHDTAFEITERGTAELGELRQISSLADREKYLEASCASSLAIPAGLIRRAISNEPRIAASRLLNSRRALLDETTLESLYEYFDALRKAVGEGQEDLLAPAIVWVRYLSAAASSVGPTAAHGV